MAFLVWAVGGAGQNPHRALQVVQLSPHTNGCAAASVLQLRKNQHQPQSCAAHTVLPVTLVRVDTCVAQGHRRGSLKSCTASGRRSRPGDDRQEADGDSATCCGQADSTRPFPVLADLPSAFQFRPLTTVLPSSGDTTAPALRPDPRRVLLLLSSPCVPWVPDRRCGNGLCGNGLRVKPAFPLCHRVPEYAATSST